MPKPATYLEFPGMFYQDADPGDNANLMTFWFQPALRRLYIRDASGWILIADGIEGVVPNGVVTNVFRDTFDIKQTRIVDGSPETTVVHKLPETSIENVEYDEVSGELRQTKFDSDAEDDGVEVIATAEECDT